MFHFKENQFGYDIITLSSQARALYRTPCDKWKQKTLFLRHNV